MRLWKVCGCRFIDYEKDGKSVRAKEYHFASPFPAEEGVGTETAKKYYPLANDPKLNEKEEVILSMDFKKNVQEVMRLADVIAFANANKS